MPIYEYRCPNCKKKVSVFFRSLSDVDHASARCPNCGSGGLVRLMSRVRVIRGSSQPASDGGGDEDFGADMLDGLDENDPRSMGRFMRKMAEESGEDMPPEFGEVVNRLERGESPEDIEKSMPELSEMAGDTGDDEGSDGDEL